MTVLIRGAGFSNRGGEAMLRTTRQELGRRLDNAAFSLEVSSPRDRAAASAIGLRIFDHEHVSPLAKAAHLAATLVRHPSFLRTARMAPGLPLRLRDIRAVVDASGFCYADAWGPWADHSARHAWMFVNYCARTRRPYVFLPQAWGPFTRPSLRRYASLFCPRAAAVYARDEESLSHLTALLGPRAGRVSLGPDVAFRFKADEPEVGRAMLISAGIDPAKGPVIGLAPSVRIYERSAGEGTENAHVRALTEAVRYVRKQGAAVALIPHEIFNEEGRLDDLHVCGRINEALGPADRVPVIAEADTAAAVKSVIGHLDLLIASRFHSIVAALSQRVPAVVIGWSHKYVELMRAVQLDDCVADSAQPAIPDLLDLISKAWAARHDNRQILQQRLPAIERQVDMLFDQVARMILTRSCRPEVHEGHK